MDKYLFSLIINLVETFTIIFFAVNYLVLNHKYKYWNFICIWLLIFIEVSYFNSKDVPYLIETGIQIISLIIYVNIISNENIIIKSFISIFSYVILYLSNIAVLFTFSAFMEIEVSQLPAQSYFNIIIIISKIVYFCICLIIIKFRNHRKIINLNNRWIILIPLLFMLFILAMNFLELILRGVINYNLLYLSIVLLIISCFLLYFLLNFIEKDTEKRTHELFVIQQLKYQKENMEDIKELNEEIRRIKHDLKHKLSYILEGLKDNKTEEMIKMLEKSYSEIDNTKLISFSNNESLNYILQSKNKLAFHKGIKFRCEITYEKSDKIHEEDFIILLGNLLDNAIENSTNGGEVVLYIETIKEILHIKVTNPISSDIINTKVTSKIDKRNHGFGMKSIQNIIHKYKGDMKEIVNEGLFIIDILI